jgi:type IV pilus assembly protein PilM
MFGFRGFKKGRRLVGLDIGSSSVKAVELRKKGSGQELVSLGIDNLSQDTVVDGAIMDANAVSSAIERIFADNKIEATEVVTSVSGHSVIVKRVSVSAGSEQELAEAIPYEAQQHIPFDMADVNFSYHVVGPSPTGTGLDTILVAVKREKVLNHTNVVSQAGKTATIMDIDAFALQNAFELNYDPPPEHTVALLNIGASMMNINVVKAGAPLFTRDVSVGGNQYTDTLQKELELSFEDAEKLKIGEPVGNISPAERTAHLRSVSEILLLEVQKTFDFFHQTSPSETINHIYIAGGSARVEGLAELMEAEFKVPVEVLNPFRRVTINANKFDLDYINAVAPRMTVAVGLALRSFDAL